MASPPLLLKLILSAADIRRANSDVAEDSVSFDEFATRWRVVGAAVCKCCGCLIVCLFCAFVTLAHRDVVNDLSRKKTNLPAYDPPCRNTRPPALKVMKLDEGLSLRLAHFELTFPAVSHTGWQIDEYNIAKS